VDWETLIVILILLYIFRKPLGFVSKTGKEAGKGIFTCGCMLAILAIILAMAGGGGLFFGS